MRYLFEALTRLSLMIGTGIGTGIGIELMNGMEWLRKTEDVRLGEHRLAEQTEQ